jgi:hypothetical protein
MERGPCDGVSVEDVDTALALVVNHFLDTACKPTENKLAVRPTSPSCPETALRPDECLPYHVASP